MLKSPAVMSGSEKQGSEQASSLVAAHPIDQSKVSNCDTIVCKSVPHATAYISVCIRVCRLRRLPLQCSRCASVTYEQPQ